MHTIIGANIKKLRDTRAWTQEQLAAAAVVTERTIQRAEAGQPVAAESLQAIAGAFGVALEDLRRDEAGDAAKRELKNYETIPLVKVELGTELAGLMPPHGHMVEVFGNDAQPPPDDAIAELRQGIVDVGDIWRDVGPADHHRMLAELRPSLQALKVAGYFVSAGIHRMKVGFADPGPKDGYKPRLMVWDTLLLIVARDARPHAIVDRRAVLDGIRRM